MYKKFSNSRHPQERSDARIQASKHKALYIKTNLQHIKNINQTSFYNVLS